MEKQHIKNMTIMLKNIKKYGDNTVILMQLGSFYELCSVTDKISYGEPNIHICVIQFLIWLLQKKYKDKNDYKEYYQGGFPIISYDKYVPLLNKNYTIVFIDQITEKPHIKREVTNILSPGTNIKHQNDSNYLLSIFIERYTRSNKEFYIVGISSIDLSTGENYVHYIHNMEEKYWMDEITRLIHFYNPSELMFHTENYELTDDIVMNQWDISDITIRINHYNNDLYKSISYQNDMLNKIFKLDLMVDPIDYFNFSHKKELVNSYIYLLEYINDHQPDILNNINHPVEYIPNNYLVLNSNSIRQLNLVNNYSYYHGKNESLLEICNKCVTPMGSRTIKNRLLYPSIDKNIIKERYNTIESLINNSHYINLREFLRYISDIEKTLRLISINKITPYELYSSYLSYEFVNKTIKYSLENELTDIDAELYDKYNKYFNLLEGTFEFSNITNNTKPLERSIFKKGYDTELDNISGKNDEYIVLIERFCHRFSNIIEYNSSDKNLIKYSTDRDNTLYIYLTNSRCTKLKQKIKNMGNTNIHIRDSNDNIIATIHTDDICFKKKDNSSMMFDIPIIKKISSEIIELQDKLVKRVDYLYNKFIETNYSIYKDSLKYINNYIANIDFLTTGAKISIDNKYVKPELIDDCSHIDVLGIRHPIVEKINKETEYVKNDIYIGKNKPGMLLYGTNACGKSTLMKSLGLNLIMAQAGLYVAADSFKYSIYTQIFTRILNNDNIFRSQSSFAIEMEELRTIEKRADDKSLV